MKRSLVLACCGLAIAGLGHVAAQDRSDLTLPPQLDEPAPAGARASRPETPVPASEAGTEGPQSARLAGQPEERAGLLEEVIVVGDTEWRLPDLGSAWRENHEQEEAKKGRIDVTFLPLYDPERADPYADLFPRQGELQRVGFIELFRLRFGGRSRD